MIFNFSINRTPPLNVPFILAMFHACGFIISRNIASGYVVISKRQKEAANGFFFCCR